MANLISKITRSPEHSIEDSPLCDRCRALHLDALVELPLGQENLPDTIWNRPRPYTWRTDWCDEEMESAARIHCSLCKVVRSLGASKLGAHSAQTFFKSTGKSQCIPDTTIFELYYHTSTLLVPEIEDEGASPFSVGARVINLAKVDYNLIRQWLLDCSKLHGATCSGTSGLLRGLKVIDCRTREVVSAPENCKYVALSYLWGQKPFTDHEQQGNGVGLTGHVPQVVQDAMIVSVEMEIQYLWVDRYCIDQTDAAEKHHLIRQMDRIYNAAALTIISAAGGDAEYGLPGVSGIPRQFQPSITIGGRRFLAFPDSTEEVRLSKWATRGWTYQEGLLSRRRLVFTPSQVYFQCMESHCWEGLAFPWHAVQPLKFYQVFPDNGTGAEAGDIISRLNEYASRQLKYGSDILNAFLGIFHAYQSKKVLHFWGLPFLAENDDKMEQEFILALGWNTRVPEVVIQREQFPSWSWVGWKRLDNLTIPWAPGNTDFRNMNRGLGFSIGVFGPSGILPLHQYARMVLSGSDFAEFTPYINVTAPSSKCVIRSAWDVEVSFPPEFRREGVITIVRLMGIPETNYGEYRDTPLSIAYLGCYTSSGLFFSFLILRKLPDSNEYTRFGTLSVVTTWLEPGWKPLRSSAGTAAQEGLVTVPRCDFTNLQTWQIRVKEFFKEEWEVREFKIS